MFNLRKFANLHATRSLFSTKEPVKIVLEQLKERSLIRAAGQDVTDFLQGLITNDIHHLGQQSGGSMYTMFLNTKGRVLYDAIVYRSQESNSYFIECDKNAVEPIQKHLKMYRVRRKVDISSLDDEYKVYALFNINNLDINANNQTKQSALDGVIIPCDKLNNTLPESSTSTKTYKDLLIFKDPRVAELGSRIISKVDANVKDQIKEILNVDLPDESKNYKVFRYSLGVGEGLTDLPQANCFPLECNCDYLHGISFHKGCYIGQELTARTHHTGVVRKRLMPLNFIKVPSELPTDNTIIHDKVNNLGRLRGIEGNVGLALLRISKALDIGEIQVGDGVARVKKPKWWPLEAPKEKVVAERN